jgi:hypothetical protein
MRRCDMIVNPGDSTDIECGKPVLDGWTICRDCLRGLQEEFDNEELGKMYAAKSEGGCVDG